MAKPNESIEDLIAEAQAIGLENWRVTPGAIGSLVVRAYELGIRENASQQQKPRTAHYLEQPGTLRTIDGTDPFSRIQQGIQERIDSGEIQDNMPDLVGPNLPDARIRSSQIEGERTA